MDFPVLGLASEVGGRLAEGSETVASLGFKSTTAPPVEEEGYCGEEVMEDLIVATCAEGYREESMGGYGAVGIGLLDWGLAVG